VNCITVNGFDFVGIDNEAFMNLDEFGSRKAPRQTLDSQISDQFSVDSMQGDVIAQCFDINNIIEFNPLYFYTNQVSYLMNTEVCAVSCSALCPFVP
jgi:hypothetical protein